MLEAVGTALGWSATELFLVDELTGELGAVGHWSADGSEPDGFFGHTPIKGTGVTGRVWQTGEPVWIADLETAADLCTPYERTRLDICVGHGIHTVLAVPICDGGKSLGVLTCYASVPEVQEDLLTVLLDGVAAQIAVFLGLRHAEELSRQLARSQGDFLALVGHEMRTPLASIAAHASMLAEESHALDGESHQMITTIARNAGTLQSIVTTLLDLAGLESGTVPLDLGVVDIAAVVGEAVAAVRHAAVVPDLQFEVDLPHRAQIDGDVLRLRQVVDDLLSNAVKFSRAGGRVSVTLEERENAVALVIADAGIGIPDGERDRLFERFYRAGNVRHQGIAGSGLGLSRARLIVELHGGVIALTANSQAGTTVTVHLPCGKAR
ncbi:GAF domain-containing sensor histidine kinase [Paractinoplanes durhamensis]|uniref:GAF domain-containing sensor histidine kinase n=1 Tax=Paractinoplanes durhamensis TaxID=113563 RepID=UPI0036421AF0